MGNKELGLGTNVVLVDGRDGQPYRPYQITTTQPITETPIHYQDQDSQTPFSVDQYLPQAIIILSAAFLIQVGRIMYLEWRHPYPRPVSFLEPKRFERVSLSPVIEHLRPALDTGRTFACLDRRGPLYPGDDVWGDAIRNLSPQPDRTASISGVNSSGRFDGDGFNRHRSQKAFDRFVTLDG